jgi:hypothetical protein
MAHFSKYIPIGSKSLDTGYTWRRGFGVYAFKTPDKKRVLVAVNESRSKHTLEPDIAFKEAEVITTTESAQLERSVTTEKKITVPPMSIVTAIIKKEG